MSYSDLLARARQGEVTPVTPGNPGEVTEKPVSNQSSNPGYPGYPENQRGVDVNALCREAVKGQAISAAHLRAHMSAEDVADIEAGRIELPTIRAFAVFVAWAYPEKPTAIITCTTCAHFRRHDHPHLGSCAIGHTPPGAAGFWDTDRRNCDDWEGEA